MSGRIILGPPKFTSTRPHTVAIKSLKEYDEGELVPSHADLAAAPSVADEDMRASDWVDEINAASTQADLDAVAQRYADSGKDYKTVEEALDRKQASLDDED